MGIDSGNFLFKFYENKTELVRRTMRLYSREEFDLVQKNSFVRERFLALLSRVDDVLPASIEVQGRVWWVPPLAI